MLRMIMTALVSFIAFATTQAWAQDMSAGFDVKSAYVLDDAIVATDELVVQGSLNYDLGNGFTAGVWGSTGVETNVGQEIDITLTYQGQLSETTSWKLGAARYIFPTGTSDMNAFDVTITRGAFDVKASVFRWDDSSLGNAEQLQFGYNVDWEGPWSGRAELTFEQGFNLDDTVIIGGELRYALSEQVSFTVTGYHPLQESGANESRLVAGLSFSF